jgi:hypothetical protein
MGKLIAARSSRPVRPRESPETQDGDFGLVIMAVGFWLLSAARVWTALQHHETFQTEGTLALACLVLVPWLLLRGRWRRRPQPEPNGQARRFALMPRRNVAQPTTGAREGAIILNLPVRGRAVATGASDVAVHRRLLFSVDPTVAREKDQDSIKKPGWQIKIPSRSEIRKMPC